MCDSKPYPEIFWGCPAPLSQTNYSIKNPPFMRPNLVRNPPFNPGVYRVQTTAERQPSRGPILKPWDGQKIPARPVAYSPYASW